MKSGLLLSFIEGPLTSVSELQARTGPSLREISVTTRGRPNTTGADTASLAAGGREPNQGLPHVLSLLNEA